MASPCNCLRLIFECSDESTFNIDLDYVGLENGKNYYIGEFTSKEYKLYWDGDSWILTQTNPIYPEIILYSDVDGTTPCNIGYVNWYFDDTTNFTYCDGNEPPTAFVGVTELTCPTPTPTQTPTQTPTPTPTPTPTMTPAPPVVPTPPCLQGTNECTTITIFPMSVTCQVTQPSSSNASDGSSALIITGGTPPYTIVWDNLNIGQTIYNLGPGTYTATVIDYYGDFSSKTSCVLFGPTPTPTMTPTPSPTTPFIEYNICFKIPKLNFAVTFIPSGIKNGKPYWSGTTGGNDYELLWSSSTSQWILDPSPVNNGYVLNNNSTYPPISNWVILGELLPPPIVTIGSCPPPPFGKSILGLLGDPIPTELLLEVSKNDPSCGCDGGITIVGNGGTPPYSYSINGGLSYRNIPIFNNLCGGIYSPTIMDSNSFISTTNIVLNQPSNPVTYTVTLNTTSTIRQNTGGILTKEYSTLVNVTPPLEDGVTLNLDLSHTNIFKTSPNTASTTNLTYSILYKNGVIETITQTGTTEGTTFNTFAGCQANTINIKSTTDTWQSLQITNSDTLLLVTTTTIIQNEEVNCYVGTSDETYSITNVSLQGCGCCNVISA